MILGDNSETNAESIVILTLGLIMVGFQTILLDCTTSWLFKNWAEVYFQSERQMGTVNFYERSFYSPQAVTLWCWVFM